MQNRLAKMAQIDACDLLVGKSGKLSFASPRSRPLTHDKGLHWSSAAFASENVVMLAPPKYSSGKAGFVFVRPSAANANRVFCTRDEGQT